MPKSPSLRPARRGSKDVGRLDVAVHHASLVHVGQRVRQLGAQRRRLGGAEGPVAQGLGERDSFHVLHHDVRLIAGETRVEEPHQTGVLEGLEGAGFVCETLDDFGVAEADDLHGDSDVGAHVTCLVDIGHPAPPDQSNKAIVPAEGFSDQCHERVPPA